MVPMVMVVGDMTGNIDSPLYGMFTIGSTLDQQMNLEQYYIHQPDGLSGVAVLWDGNGPLPTKHSVTWGLPMR